MLTDGSPTCRCGNELYQWLDTSLILLCDGCNLEEADCDCDAPPYEDSRSEEE